MKIEEYNAIMTQIGDAMADPTKVDVPKVTSLLSKVRDDYTQTTADLLTAQKEATDNKKAYDDAMKYNMELFLSKGVTPNDPNKTTEIKPTTEEKITTGKLDLSNF